MQRELFKELGPDVPLHFTAFHPDFKMLETPRTPPATLRRARQIALAQGLHYVYTGNVHDAEGGTTFCPGCGAPLIERDWHQIRHYRLTAEGRCPQCHTAIAGRFDQQAGAFGQRRIPLRLNPQP